MLHAIVNSNDGHVEQLNANATKNNTQLRERNIVKNEPRMTPVTLMFGSISLTRVSRDI